MNEITSLLQYLERLRLWRGGKSVGCEVRQTWIGISAPRLNVGIIFTSMSSSVKWVNTNPTPQDLEEGENELGPV